jgi:hypothetical protein
MTTETAAALLRALGQAIDMPQLAFDADGTCVLRFDGTTVMLEDDAGQHRIVLHAAIGTAPAEGRAAFFARLLEANLLWRDTAGATFSLDKASDRVLLMLAIPLDTAPVRVPDLVGRFVDAAEAWVGLLPGLSPEAGGAPAHEAPIDPSRYV